jgi:GTP-binding protein
MIPVIAIVGRANVGKSTLFNRLTRSQDALVVDQPGVTRDRQIGQGEWEGKPYIIIDTGGIIDDPQDHIEAATAKQAMQAMQEADILFFVVDARQGLTPMDSHLAQQLRRQKKELVLVINKVDGLNPEIAMSDFYRLGFDLCAPIAASHNWGINELIGKSLDKLGIQAPIDEVVESATLSPKVAIVGRPNVGKSTLVNRMFGEERVIVCDQPGTTRDSIYVPMKRPGGKSYTLIDTAGVRKKRSVNEVVEKFSVVKTLQSIKDANVVVVVFDATVGLTDQDLSLIGFTIEAGRALIICANKWDGMHSDDKEQVKSQLKYGLRFAHFAPIHFISALHGTGVGDLFGLIDKVYNSANIELTTSQISTILDKAITSHPPPLVQGRRIKLRYAHCGGHNPPTIVIHGNQTDELPQSYQKYLSNYFMKALKIQGTPIRIVFRTGENPYKDKRNVLTPRQLYKRQRLMRHVKKKSKRT